MIDHTTIIVIFGASGDLSRKKIYPSLWELFHAKKLPRHLKIIGFSRSVIKLAEFVESIKKFCKFTGTGDQEKFSEFTKQLNFYSGDYQDHVFKDFENYLTEHVGRDRDHNRIFYFALPPSVYGVVSSFVSRYLCTCPGPIRVVLEKPFGYDLESAQLLNKAILELFQEDQIYRIDHYLGKEMVQNILAVRFANFVLSSLWDRNHISNVLISFKEDIGTYGRGNYYDNAGVIRDIIQNHMIQVLSLLAMEQPKSLNHIDVKNAKIKLLQEILPIKMEDVVVGQYIGNPDANPSIPVSKGYKDDKLVPPDSITPTFANIVMYINNDRWRGVPFILKAGKALKEKSAEVRVQFKPISNGLFEKSAINELVIKMQPDEAIYMKLLLKLPGEGFNLHITELDLTYKDRHKDFQIHDAYVKLIMDIINGTQVHFVRSDEVEEAWKIFTPVLKNLEDSKIQPIPYVFGTRGPSQADDLNRKVGFVYDPDYKWVK